MILTLILLVGLSVGAIGIPAIWLIRQQIDQQAVALLNQSSRTVQALLTAQQSDLANLVLITAQRPMLHQLIQQNDLGTLQAYLQTLQSSANLDSVLICNADQKTIAQAGFPLPASACAQTSAQSIYRFNETEPTGWMLSAQPVMDLPENTYIIVGKAFDQQLIQDLQAQVELEYIFLFKDQYMAGSFPNSTAIWKQVAAYLPQAEASADPKSITLQNMPYIGTRSRFNTSEMDIITLLPRSDIVHSQQQMTLAIGGGTLLVIFLSSILGIFLAQRLSLPLERLRRSAIALRMGDLTTPVAAKTRVREIAQVSYALEDARITLEHSLSVLNQEKAWINHLLKAVVEGIVTLDRTGRITYFSQGAEHITGWQQDQAMDKKIDDIFHLPENDEVFSSHIPTPGGKQAIITVLVKDSPITLAVTAAKLSPPEMGRSGTVLVFRDVSDEEAIHRLLGDFLANITHEFRTPLSALAASIELLLDQLDTLNPEELKELLNSLHLGVLSLQTLTDNLLEGASIEAGRFRVQPRSGELTEIVTEAVRIMQPLLNKYNQRLIIELPADLPEIMVDMRRTGQVLINLLSNAIKWSPKGSEITLKAEIDASQDSVGCRVKVSIGDQGPGISSDRKQDLFKRFAHRQVRDQRTEHGAGLGLSVVKTIVEAQNGQVGVADRTGGGAIFWFTIPIANSNPNDLLSDPKGRIAI